MAPARVSIGSHLQNICLKIRPNSGVFLRNRGGKQRTGDQNGREWSRIEREIGSAASEHACGVQTAAGEGHRRSLLSCSPLGWGRLRGRKEHGKSNVYPYF